MSLTRRVFLRNAVAGSLAFGGLRTLIACRDAPPPQAPPESESPLVADPGGIVDLLPGYSYRVLSRVGDAMADGFLVPGLPDGMATFAGPEGLTLLIRNHELEPDAVGMGPFGAGHALLEKLSDDALYDLGQRRTPCLGGTTTVVYDTRKQEVVRQFLSLAGTCRNCAGGPTPWNTWISCEETVERAGGPYDRDHGFAFEVPASAEPGLAEPIPLRDMGRFNHEAVAVDPASGVLYLSEDRGDGLMYRFLPEVPGRPAAGGRLQALAVRDRPSLETGNRSAAAEIAVGETLAVRWIDLEDVLSPDDSLRHQGFAAGAARFSRPEGMWHGEGAIYFACTSGGRAGCGQIWRYRPSPAEGTSGEEADPGRLELFVEPNDASRLDCADNLTVAPWGDLIVCEDGPGQQFLVGVRPDGSLYPFARNAGSGSEFAGAVFSPDASTLFVNIQGDGLTLAITGPWPERGGPLRS